MPNFADAERRIKPKGVAADGVTPNGAAVCRYAVRHLAPSGICAVGHSRRLAFATSGICASSLLDVNLYDSTVKLDRRPVLAS